MISHPPKIDILPEHLIDQIKAGEVIERPGNLVKEIIENAVDAQSTKIELSLKNNGLDLISLKDNGHGMRLHDLPFAFSRHATSKISRFEDLYRLHSFGFRGEALASIAAISKLQCISQTADAPVASELRIEGGQTIYHGERQTGTGTHGTELQIQDLFFNTPARLKFIQSQQAEKTFIKKIIYSFVLAHPEIEFHIKLDEIDKDIFPARSSHIERLMDIFPKGKDRIKQSERFYENNELKLFLIPDQFKAASKIQNIYINNRFILDKQLHRVMYQALESVSPGEKFQYVAYFNLPPDTIDVNVHPNKTIIKCLETSKMISLLTSTVKELLTNKVSRDFSAPVNQSQGTPLSFIDHLTAAPTLHQERHDYNMEGFFSPHQLPDQESEDYIWLQNYFIKKIENQWMAFSATKLLSEYCQKKLQSTSVTIPLLVSEPFSAKNVKIETLEKLRTSGLEIEHLGPETLVLRGIPEWMNGFPLKAVVQLLLFEKDFSELVLEKAEWSESTWDEILFSLNIDELVKNKVALDLYSLFREKLR